MIQCRFYFVLDAGIINKSQFDLNAMIVELLNVLIVRIMEHMIKQCMKSIYEKKERLLVLLIQEIEEIIFSAFWEAIWLKIHFAIPRKPFKTLGNHGF